jgi:hypothetical protein
MDNLSNLRRNFFVYITYYTYFILLHYMELSTTREATRC